MWTLMFTLIGVIGAIFGFLVLVISHWPFSRSGTETEEPLQQVQSRRSSLTFGFAVVLFTASSITFVVSLVAFDFLDDIEQLAKQLGVRECVHNGESDSPGNPLVTVPPDHRCKVEGIGTFEVDDSGRATVAPYVLSPRGSGKSEDIDAQIKLDPEPAGHPHGFHSRVAKDGMSWEIWLAGEWQLTGDNGACGKDLHVFPGQYCIWNGAQFRVYAVDALIPSDIGSGLDKGRPYLNGYAVLMKPGLRINEQIDDRNVRCEVNNGKFAASRSESDGVTPGDAWVIQEASPTRLGDAVTRGAECERPPETSNSAGDSAPGNASQARDASPPMCSRDLTLTVGGLCAVPGAGTFEVTTGGATWPSSAGFQRRGWLQADVVTAGRHITLQALEAGSTNTWTVVAAGEWQDLGQCSSVVGEEIRPGQFCFWGSQPFRVYATGEVVNERHRGDDFSSGFAEVERPNGKNESDAHRIVLDDTDQDRTFSAHRSPVEGSTSWIVDQAD